MNRFSGLCVAGLLLVVMPTALARSAAQDVPPAEAPEAEPAKDAAASPTAPASETTRDVDQAVDAIRGYSAELRDKALANAKRAAEDLDSQIARLQAQTDQRWSRMSHAARTRSRATMAELQERRNALAEWSGGLRHGSAAAWGEVRSGFVASYHALAEALRKARAQLEQDEKPVGDDPAVDEQP